MDCVFRCSCGDLLNGQIDSRATGIRLAEYAKHEGHTGRVLWTQSQQVYGRRGSDAVRKPLTENQKERLLLSRDYQYIRHSPNKLEALSKEWGIPSTTLHDRRKRLEQNDARAYGHPATANP